MAQLHPRREAIWRRGPTPRVSLLVFALIVAIAAAPYAVTQLGEQVGAPAGELHAAEMHYAGMSALVVTLVLSAGVAGLGADGWRLVGRLVAVSTAIFGVACVLMPFGVSSLGLLGGVVALVAGSLFLVGVEREARRA